MANESKSPSEMTPEQVQKELANLQLEEQRLRIIELRDKVAGINARREALLRRQEQTLQDLADYNAQVRAEQAECKHRKGGRNREGVLNGHDSNFSIIKHTYPWGVVAVQCTRCSKTWWPPRSKEQKQYEPEQFEAAKKKDEYQRQLREYQEMLNAPTDNEPSGTQLFVITPAAQQASA